MNDDVRITVWRFGVDTWEGIVYTQAIALDKFAAGYDIEIGTITRHANGDRTYEWGVVK